MKFKILLSVAAIVAASGQLHAQYATDALRFSQTSYGSTARFKGLAGAQIGIGGDLSALGGNPAGLGLFTRSEFSLTPELNNYSTQSLYLNSQTKSSEDRLNLAQAAAVWNFPIYKKEGADLRTGWLNYTVGVGYNRTNDFGNNIVFSGANFQNSIADYFADLATIGYGEPTTLPTGTLESMAYEDYLINYDPTTDTYSPATALNNDQRRSELRSGSQSEMNFALGANYSNKFYIGASINLVSLKYTSDTEYTEQGLNFTEDSDYNLSFRQNQITKGSGVNGRLGVLFRPSDALRFGVTFETPTYYTIDDSYAEVLNTRYTPELPIAPVGNAEQYYDFSYKLRTPVKVSGGIGVFFTKNGFIAADVDYVDYSKITFSSADNGNADRIADENRFVLANYQSAVNYRLGAEYKLERFMLRAGYGVQGSPYKELKNEIKTYSAGLGYRFSKFYLDLSYQNMKFDTEMKPYTLQSGTAPSASIENAKNNVYVTLGARF